LEDKIAKEIRAINKKTILYIVVFLLGIILTFNSHSLIIEIIGLILFLLGIFQSFECLTQKEKLVIDNKLYMEKIIISYIIISLIILVFGIMLMFRSHSVIIKVISFILFLFGIIFSLGGLSIKKRIKNLSADEKIEFLFDTHKYIVNKFGGAENIDIDLSKYDNRNQLIILKDKSILIGYNNFETEKIINFDSIVNVDIKVKNIIVESEAGYNNYYRNIIESIVVYIHTKECTEELVFEYLFFKDKQEKYNEILNGLNRFKTMIDDTLDTNDLNNKTNINYKEKSIPEQIKEYKELLDIGAITESEYDTKKKELLSK
jgi:hypothetical protein